MPGSQTTEYMKYHCVFQDLVCHPTDVAQAARLNKGKKSKFHDRKEGRTTCPNCWLRSKQVEGESLLEQTTASAAAVACGCPLP